MCRAGSLVLWFSTLTHFTLVYANDWLYSQTQGAQYLPGFNGLDRVPSNSLKRIVAQALAVVNISSPLREPVSFIFLLATLFPRPGRIHAATPCADLISRSPELMHRAIGGIYLRFWRPFGGACSSAAHGSRCGRHRLYSKSNYLSAFHAYRLIFAVQRITSCSAPIIHNTQRIRLY
ncbi:hypothetical protein JB92DRAFT_679210 [Gautieria morchelliformis]|nr:hypothetical protein JB92DRAFT_679210 [Gautieria morchelliformis]